MIDLGFLEDFLNGLIAEFYRWLEALSVAIVRFFDGLS